MSAVIKYANMKEILSGIILRRWIIEDQQQIWFNKDNFAHEEQDHIYYGSRRIKDPHIVISKGAPKGEKSLGMVHISWHRSFHMHLSKS